MNVLLISANQYAQPHPVYPLGLDYVAESIASNYSVELLDLNALDHSTALDETIDRLSPEVIGLSIRNIDTTDASNPRGFFDAYQQLAEAIRRRCSALLVLGGCGFTLFPVELMKALEADYGVIGEGERMGLLLDALSNQEDPSTLPGIITKNNAGAVPTPWQGDIACGFKPAAPHLSYYLKNGGILNLQTKRGCRYGCIYCTYPHIEGASPRLFGPEKVAREARRMQAAGAKYLFITDSTFNSEMDHTLSVAKAFKRAKVTTPWGAFFAPMIPSDHYFDRLADAGLTHVEFGTESLCDPVLKAYRKPFKYKDVLKAHQAALDANLYTAHYFLFGGPGETAETLEKTLDRAGRLEKCVQLLFSGMRIYPHTELYNIAKRQGQLTPATDLTTPTFYQNQTLSKGELVARVKKWAHGHPNRIIGSGGEKVAEELSKLYTRGISGPLWEFLIR